MQIFSLQLAAKLTIRYATTRCTHLTEALGIKALETKATEMKTAYQVINVLEIFIFFYVPLGDWVRVSAVKMFRGSLYVALIITLIGVNTLGWRMRGVNHVLIFEVNPRDHLTAYQLMGVRILINCERAVLAYALLLCLDRNLYVCYVVDVPNWFLCDVPMLEWKIRVLVANCGLGYLPTVRAESYQNTAVFFSKVVS